MGEAEQATIHAVNAISEIAAAEWDACACPDPVQFNPFLSHAFLLALEQSGSVSARAGWAPQHLLLSDECGAIAGVMPLYLKSHSLGEYVFDHAWADAYERAGGRYYPKLQSAVPFTPVTGRRLLLRPGPNPQKRAYERALLQGALELTSLHGASSLHLTFVSEAEWRFGGALGLLQRTDQQFHWQNQGYKDFDDFLAQLASRKRKAIRKERRTALGPGIDVEWVTGNDLSEAHWDAFFDFYMDTGSRKWGRPYLNRQFFSLIGAAMPERILLVMARRAGRIIAGALNFIGGDTLYGRYWGAIEQHDCLHFEICYYQAIDYAIAHGLARVEAGAQGEHKLARGYGPQTTYSLHYLADPGLAQAVARFLEREREWVADEAAALNTMTPFRKGGATD